MANYPNMSYCMCENTLGALGQVLEAMESEGPPEFLRDLSRTERQAFVELFEACEDFMRMARFAMESEEAEETV